MSVEHLISKFCYSRRNLLKNLVQGTLGKKNVLFRSNAWSESESTYTSTFIGNLHWQVLDKYHFVLFMTVSKCTWKFNKSNLFFITTNN